MKLIKSSFLIKEQEPGLEGIYKQIEWAGRHCYKSLDKITEDSAKGFVDRLIKSGHTSVLEHGSIYLYIETDTEPSLMVKEIINFYKYNKYSHVNTKYILDKNQDSHTPLIIGYKYYISTNLRVCIENDRKEFLNPSLLCEPTEYHEKRICVRFICDRGVSHEFVRHRVMSFAQESTRYCNYSKDKFDNELTYICPCWLDYNRIQELTEIANRNNKEVYRMGHDESLSMEERGLCSFIYDMSNHEHGYLFQISTGWTPQQARAVLPNALKTELVMTGFVSDWKHFFELRSNKYGKGGAHPQANELATPLYEEFKKREYI